MNVAGAVLGFYIPMSAQTTPSSGLTAKLSSIPTDIFVLLVIILAELIVILFLAGTIMQYISATVGLKKEKTAIAKGPSLFQRLNETVAIEDEDKLDLNHNYDGVRELDNKTPGWWVFGFYGSILFAVIYLYRVFISGSMPSQVDELKKEYELADILKSQMLTTAANNVDENTVSLLDAEGISKGAMTFKANCVVCHGANGEGNTVGPNLTDQYWIHKGGLKDIFKTIKYGFPEKGMKSWKDDFSPGQIAELASYVKSLAGSNPANPKEKQGDLYIDSSGVSTPTDTIK